MQQRERRSVVGGTLLVVVASLLAARAEGQGLGARLERATKIDGRHASREWIDADSRSINFPGLGTGSTGTVWVKNTDRALFVSASLEIDVEDPPIFHLVSVYFDDDGNGVLDAGENVWTARIGGAWSDATHTGTLHETVDDRMGHTDVYAVASLRPIRGTNPPRARLLAEFHGTLQSGDSADFDLAPEASTRVGLAINFRGPQDNRLWPGQVVGNWPLLRLFPRPGAAPVTPLSRAAETILRESDLELNDDVQDCPSEKDSRDFDGNGRVDIHDAIWLINNGEDLSLVLELLTELFGDGLVRASDLRNWKEIWVDFDAEDETKWCGTRKRPYRYFTQIPDDELDEGAQTIINVIGDREITVHPDVRWKVKDKSNITIRWRFGKKKPIIRQYERLDPDDPALEWIEVRPGETAEPCDDTLNACGIPAEPCVCRQPSTLPLMEAPGTGLWMLEGQRWEYVRFERSPGDPLADTDIDAYHRALWNAEFMDENHHDSPGTRQLLEGRLIDHPSEEAQWDSANWTEIDPKTGEEVSRSATWVYVPPETGLNPSEFFTGFRVVQENRWLFDFRRCDNIKIDGLRMEFGFGFARFENTPESADLNCEALMDHLCEHSDHMGFEVTRCEGYMLDKFVLVGGGSREYKLDDACEEDVLPREELPVAEPPDGEVAGTVVDGRDFQTYVSGVKLHHNNLDYCGRHFFVRNHARDVAIYENRATNVGGTLTEGVFVYCGNIFNWAEGTSRPETDEEFENWTRRNVRVFANHVTDVAQGIRYGADGWIVSTDSFSGGVETFRNYFARARQPFVHNGGHPHVVWRDNLIEDVYRMGNTNDAERQNFATMHIRGNSVRLSRDLEGERWSRDREYMDCHNGVRRTALYAVPPITFNGCSMNSPSWPVGDEPVVIEDNLFIGNGSCLYEGILDRLSDDPNSFSPCIRVQRNVFLGFPIPAAVQACRSNLCEDECLDPTMACVMTVLDEFDQNDNQSR